MVTSLGNRNRERSQTFLHFRQTASLPEHPLCKLIVSKHVYQVFVHCIRVNKVDVSGKYTLEQMTNFLYHQGAVQGFVYSTVSFSFPANSGKLKETVEYTKPCTSPWWYRKFVICSSDKDANCQTFIRN